MSISDFEQSLYELTLLINPTHLANITTSKLNSYYQDTILDMRKVVLVQNLFNDIYNNWTDHQIRYQQNRRRQIENGEITEEQLLAEEEMIEAESAAAALAAEGGDMEMEDSNEYINDEIITEDNDYPMDSEVPIYNENQTITEERNDSIKYSDQRDQIVSEINNNQTNANEDYSDMKNSNLSDTNTNKNIVLPARKSSVLHTSSGKPIKSKKAKLMNTNNTTNTNTNSNTNTNANSTTTPITNNNTNIDFNNNTTLNNKNKENDTNENNALSSDVGIVVPTTDTINDSIKMEENNSVMVEDESDDDDVPLSLMPKMKMEITKFKSNIVKSFSKDRSKDKNKDKDSKVINETTKDEKSKSPNLTLDFSKPNVYTKNSQSTTPITSSTDKTVKDPITDNVQQVKDNNSLNGNVVSPKPENDSKTIQSIESKSDQISTSNPTTPTPTTPKSSTSSSHSHSHSHSHRKKFEREPRKDSLKAVNYALSSEKPDPDEIVKELKKNGALHRKRSGKKNDDNKSLNTKEDINNTPDNRINNEEEKEIDSMTKSSQMNEDPIMNNKKPISMDNNQKSANGSNSSYVVRSFNIPSASTTTTNTASRNEKTKEIPNVVDNTNNDNNNSLNANSSINQLIPIRKSSSFNKKNNAYRLSDRFVKKETRNKKTVPSTTVSPSTPSKSVNNNENNKNSSKTQQHSGQRRTRESYGNAPPAIQRKSVDDILYQFADVMDIVSLIPQIVGDDDLLIGNDLNALNRSLTSKSSKEGDEDENGKASYTRRRPSRAPTPPPTVMSSDEYQTISLPSERHQKYIKKKEEMENKKKRRSSLTFEYHEFEELKRQQELAGYDVSNDRMPVILEKEKSKLTSSDNKQSNSTANTSSSNRNSIHLNNYMRNNFISSPSSSSSSPNMSSSKNSGYLSSSPSPSLSSTKSSFNSKKIDMLSSCKTSSSSSSSSSNNGSSNGSGSHSNKNSSTKKTSRFLNSLSKSKVKSKSKSKSKDIVPPSTTPISLNENTTSIEANKENNVPNLLITNTKSSPTDYLVRRKSKNKNKIGSKDKAHGIASESKTSPNSTTLNFQRYNYLSSPNTSSSSNSSPTLSTNSTASSNSKKYYYERKNKSTPTVPSSKNSSNLFDALGTSSSTSSTKNSSSKKPTKSSSSSEIDKFFDNVFRLDWSL